MISRKILQRILNLAFPELFVHSFAFANYLIVLLSNFLNLLLVKLCDIILELDLAFVLYEKTDFLLHQFNSL